MEQKNDTGRPLVSAYKTLYTDSLIVYAVFNNPMGDFYMIYVNYEGNDVPMDVMASLNGENRDENYVTDSLNRLFNLNEANEDEVYDDKLKLCIHLKNLMTDSALHEYIKSLF